VLCFHGCSVLLLGIAEEVVWKHVRVPPAGTLAGPPFPWRASAPGAASVLSTPHSSTDGGCAPAWPYSPGIRRPRRGALPCHCLLGALISETASCVSGQGRHRETADRPVAAAVSVCCGFVSGPPQRALKTQWLLAGPVVPFCFIFGFIYLSNLYTQRWARRKPQNQVAHSTDFSSQVSRVFVFNFY